MSILLFLSFIMIRLFLIVFIINNEKNWKCKRFIFGFLIVISINSNLVYINFLWKTYFSCLFSYSIPEEFYLFLFLNLFLKNDINTLEKLNKRHSNNNFAFFEILLFFVMWMMNPYASQKLILFDSLEN